MAVGLAACGVLPDALQHPADPLEIPASVEELRGPWRSTPLHVDPAAVREMDAQCLATHEMAPSVSLVAVDARGEGGITLVYAGDDGHQGTCGATVQADGQFVAAPGGYTVWPQEIEVVPVGENELRVVNQGGNPGSAAPEDWWAAMSGQAGPGID